LGKARFSRISRCPNKSGHRSVNFGSIEMETKTCILVVQGHFGAKLFILVPNLKCKQKNPDFEVREFFTFSTSTGPGHRNFFDPKPF